MVAPVDTALSEQGNAVGFEEATPPTPVEVAVETEAAIEPTTEASAPETTETEPVAPVDPLADVDDERLFSHPKVVDRLRREAESVRQKSERATEQRIQDQRSSWVATGQAFQDVHAALADGNVQQAQNLLGAALANRDWQAVNVVDRIARGKLEGAQVSTADIDRLDAALNAAQRGTGTLDAYAETLLEVRAKAYAESTLAPALEKRIRAEIATADKAKAQTAKVQAAEAANDAQGRPTLGVAGAGGQRVVLNTREVDAIPTATFLSLSKETQTRLVAEAREGDRTHADRLDRALIQTALGR